MRVETKRFAYEGTRDCLDGVLPLKRGQKVEIKFPDGHTEQAVVTMTSGRKHMMRPASALLFMA